MKRASEEWEWDDSDGVEVDWPSGADGTILTRLGVLFFVLILRGGLAAEEDGAISADLAVAEQHALEIGQNVFGRDENVFWRLENVFQSEDNHGAGGDRNDGKKASLRQASFD